MSHETFVAACLAGRALLEDVDDWIDAWHDGPSTTDLDTFLGFEAAEGALFAERPEALRFIIASRRLRRPVTDLLVGRDEYSLAARAVDTAAAHGVVEWLRQTGRV